MCLLGAFSPPLALPGQGPRHLRPPGGSGSEPLVNPGSPAGGGLPGRCGPLPG